MSVIETITVPIKNNLSFMESQILKRYPFLRKIKTPALLTTEIYNTIYPVLAHYLYQEIEHYDHTIRHIEEYDSNNRLLKGFTIYDNRTWEAHTFLLTYTGEWLYNHKPLNIDYIQNYNNQLICNAYELLQYNKSLTKESLHMQNIERLQMEIAGIELPHEELLVYLEESGLNGYDTYNASSSANKRAIYESALSVLHSIANQPHLMKNYKQDDMTVSEFSKHLQRRIDQLEQKVRQMPNHDSSPSNFFNLFQ